MKLGILILITFFASQSGFACSRCSKNKAFQIKQSAGTSSYKEGARVVGAASTLGKPPADFNNGFFKGVGNEGRGASAQPVAVPTGDGDEYKVIFK